MHLHCRRRCVDDARLESKTLTVVLESSQAQAGDLVDCIGCRRRRAELLNGEGVREEKVGQALDARDGHIEPSFDLPEVSHHHSPQRGALGLKEGGRCYSRRWIC